MQGMSDCSLLSEVLRTRPCLIPHSVSLRRAMIAQQLIHVLYVAAPSHLIPSEKKMHIPSYARCIIQAPQFANLLPLA
jgi:hypothetical protein